MTTDDTANQGATFVGTVEEDANGELVISFPEEMIAQLGWVEGDVIEWDTDDNGRVIARKAKAEGPVGPNA